MTVRAIFLNRSNNLRAGWRIGILLLLWLTLTATIGGLMQLLFHAQGVLIQGVAYAILVPSTFLVLKLIDRRPFHSVGLPLHSRLAVELAQGFLLSFLMITIVFVVEYLLGYVRLTYRGVGAVTILSSFVTMFLAFLWFGFGEELLFRGYCFQTLIEGTNQYVAVAFFSVIFGIFHAANPNASILGVVNTVLAGVWLSVAYLKTRTLWFPTALHASWNFFQGYVYSFPVSGLSFGDRSLFVIQQSGPDWVTGGAYGPEAGVLSTAVLLIATVYILRTPSVSVGEGVWLLKPSAEEAQTATVSQ